MRWAGSMKRRLNWCRPTWWTRPSAMPSLTWDQTHFGPCSTIQGPIFLWQRWCPWSALSSIMFCPWANEQIAQETVTRCHHSYHFSVISLAIPPQMAPLLWPGRESMPSQGKRNRPTIVELTRLTQLAAVLRRGKATMVATPLPASGHEQVQQWSF